MHDLRVVFHFSQPIAFSCSCLLNAVFFVVCHSSRHPGVGMPLGPLPPICFVFSAVVKLVYDLGIVFYFSPRCCLPCSSYPQAFFFFRDLSDFSPFLRIVACARDLQGVTFCWRVPCAPTLVAHAHILHASSLLLHFRTSIYTAFQYHCLVSIVPHGLDVAPRDGRPVPYPLFLFPPVC